MQEFIQEFVNSVVSRFTQYEYIGIRFDDAKFSVGEVIYDVSRRWEDGEPTEDLLEGLSAIDASRRDLAKLCQDYWWCGDYVYILGAYTATWGEDIGEIVLKEPEVLWVAHKSEIAG